MVANFCLEYVRNSTMNESRKYLYDPVLYNIDSILLIINYKQLLCKYEKISKNTYNSKSTNYETRTKYCLIVQ